MTASVLYPHRYDTQQALRSESFFAIIYPEKDEHSALIFYHLLSDSAAACALAEILQRTAG